jgi:hypothetical protein
VPPRPGGVYLTAANLAGRRARDDGDDLAVQADLEAVLACGPGDDLAGVDHADVDALGGDHDGAALGHAALHDDRPGLWRGHAGCLAGSAQPVPLSWRDGADLLTADLQVP